MKVRLVCVLLCCWGSHQDMINGKLGHKCWLIALHSIVAKQPHSHSSGPHLSPKNAHSFPSPSPARAHTHTHTHTHNSPLVFLCHRCVFRVEMRPSQNVGNVNEKDILAHFICHLHCHTD